MASNPKSISKNQLGPEPEDVTPTQPLKSAGTELSIIHEPEINSNLRRVLSDTDKAEILDMITAGLVPTVAFKKFGLPPEAARRFIEEHPGFALRVKQAEVEFELTHVNRIAEGRFNWQSSAWLLERKFPKRWGRKDNRRDFRNQQDTGTGLFTTNASMVPIALPPGAVPALPRPKEVQDSEGGSQKREDRELQTQAGNVPMGPLPPKPKPKDR